MVSLPFSDHCEPLVDTTEEFDLLVNYLRADKEHRAWRHIEIRSISGRFDSTERDAGFRPARTFYHHRIDLRPSISEIYRGLDKDSVRRRESNARTERALPINAAGLKSCREIFMVSWCSHEDAIICLHSRTFGFAIWSIVWARRSRFS